MTRLITNTLKALCVGSALAVMSGCATTPSEMDEMRTQLEQARSEASSARAAAAAAADSASKAQFLAERAMDAARTANSCCAANTEKMERMFKKSMTK